MSVSRWFWGRLNRPYSHSTKSKIPTNQPPGPTKRAPSYKVFILTHVTQFLGLRLTRLTSIRISSITYIWPNRLPRNSCVILCGVVYHTPLLENKKRNDKGALGPLGRGIPTANFEPSSNELQQRSCSASTRAPTSEIPDVLGGFLDLVSLLSNRGCWDRLNQSINICKTCLFVVSRSEKE